MALTLKQDFTQSTLATAADTGPTLTFSRASNAMQFDSSGTLVLTPENLVLDSQDFGAASYSQVDTLVSDQTLSDPFGGTLASEIEELTTGQNFFLSDQTLSIPAGTVMTVSVYLKLAATGNGDATVNLNLGRSGAGSFEETSQSKTLTTEWQRFSVTHVFTNTQTGSRLNVKRNDAGDATRIQIYGLQLERGAAAGSYLQTTGSANSLPRLAAHTYDTSTSSWVNRGVLIEEARTNQLLQSNTFTTTWSEVGGGVNGVDWTLTQDETGIDGQTNAWTVTKINTTDTTRWYQLSQATVTAGQTYCVSVYLKKTSSSSSYPGVSLIFATGGSGTNRADMLLNTDAGTMTERTGVSSAAVTQGVEDVGDFWRFWFSATENSSGYTKVYAELLPAVATTDTGSWSVSTTTGTAVWTSSQVELGSFPTSYIPTTTATVTRGLDELYDNTDLSYLDTSATVTGTLVANASFDYDNRGSFPNLISIWQDANNRVIMQMDTSENIDGYTFTTAGTGGDGSTLGATAITVGDDFRYALAYADNDLATSLDGASVQTSAAGDTPIGTGITSFNIGNAAPAGVNPFNGYIKDIRYWSERKPNGFLESPPAMGEEETVRLKYNMRKANAAAAQIAGPAWTHTRASAATMFNGAGTMLLAPSARQADATNKFRSSTGNDLTALETSTLTVSCWVRQPVTGTRDWPWSICDTGSDTTYIALEITAAGKWVLNRRNTTTRASTSTTSVDTDWHHIVCVLNGTSSGKIYVDGTEEAEDTNPVTFGTPSLDCIGFGELSRGTPLASAGAIDVLDVAIWDRVLSDAEILALTTTRPDAAAGGGPIHWWKCNNFESLEDVGTTGGITITEVSSPGFVSDPPSTYAVDTVARLGSHVYDTTLSSWVNRGYLSEGERTNLCLQSSDFETTWADDDLGVDITSGATTSPDGTANGTSLIQKSGGTSVDGIRQTITLSTSTAYVWSIYVKNIDAATTDFPIYGNSVEGGGIITWTAGVPAFTTEYDTSSGLTSVEDVGNGWYRVIMPYTSDAVATAHIHILEPENSGANDGNQTGIYVYGSQVEAGSFPSSYIPTTSATVTREADTMVIEDADKGSFYYSDISAGSWIAKWYQDAITGVGGGNQAVVSGGSGSHMYVEDADANLYWYDGATAAQDYEATPTTIAIDTEYEAAIGWDPATPTTKTNLDGSAEKTSLAYSGDWLIAANDIGVGVNGNTLGSPIWGHITELRFYDYELADLTDLPSFGGATFSLDANRVRAHRQIRRNRDY